MPTALKQYVNSTCLTPFLLTESLEPTGLQRLADAQIKLGKNAAAAASLQKLLAKDWPSRFGNVHSEARNKLAALDKKAG